jgi:very-short-patch-repair endonuclease
MSCSPISKSLCGVESCLTCYSRSFATHEKALLWSNKNEVKPQYVLKNSNKKYWFDCTDCGHELEMIVKNVASGQWCKYCNRDGLCDKDDCLFCHSKSFASHPMAELWSSKNNVLPRMILRRSDKKMWFNCKECGHSFEAKLFSINDKHCKYCSNQALCSNNDCNTCFEKTCASHTMSESWSSLNELQPRMVFLQSNKHIQFNCKVCLHTYETTPNHYYNRNGSCPYCANKYLCDKDNCIQCFTKSFASHPQIHCWSSKNLITPRQIFKGAEKSAIFNCDICSSEFESKLYNILTGYWCPFCKKKTEAVLLKFLRKEYPTCKTQLRFEWCRTVDTKQIMPFDFGIEEDKILIELDGRQHFSQVSNWETPEDVQTKDVEKIKRCINQGYSIIHLCQEDVWKNKYDWKKYLLEEIEQLKTSEPKCVFIQKLDVYQQHILKLENSVIYTIRNPES